MVSSALELELEELLDTLARLNREAGDDPAYREPRSALPADWPL